MKEKVTKEETVKEKNHILSIHDEKGEQLLYIGKNFEKLTLEAKVSTIQYLKKFIEGQKQGLIKMINEL